jgi:tRNA dimethylallyltransferase
LSTVLIVAGPTASGKSALAAELARRARGIVVNADSMQVYDGLPLLTAQPSPEDLKAAPHALYGALQPQTACSAAKWREFALVEIEKAEEAGLTPVIAGGTGLYLKALTEGLSPIPEVPSAFRTHAMALQRQLGTPGLHAALKKRDPETASKLDPFNTQRNMRAWEVLEATGKGLAAWQRTPREGPPAHLKFCTVVLSPDREELTRRCGARFDAMLKTGALEEVSAFKRLIDSGEVPHDAALTKALGYGELVSYLEGRSTLEEATELAKTATRQYAKRQSTWFRHQLAPDIKQTRADADEILAYLDLL